MSHLHFVYTRRGRTIRAARWNVRNVAWNPLVAWVETGFTQPPALAGQRFRLTHHSSFYSPFYRFSSRIRGAASAASNSPRPLKYLAIGDVVAHTSGQNEIRMTESPIASRSQFEAFVISLLLIFASVSRSLIIALVGSTRARTCNRKVRGSA